MNGQPPRPKRRIKGKQHKRTSSAASGNNNNNNTSLGTSIQFDDSLLASCATNATNATNVTNVTNTSTCTSIMSVGTAGTAGTATGTNTTADSTITSTLNSTLNSNNNNKGGGGGGMVKTKEEEIMDLLKEPMIDLWKLRNFCLTEGGLVNDTIRKQVWPKLVGLDAIKLASSSSSSYSTTTTNAISTTCGRNSAPSTPTRKNKRNTTSNNNNNNTGITHETSHNNNVTITTTPTRSNIDSSPSRGAGGGGERLEEEENPSLTMISDTMQHVIDPSVIKSKNARMQVMSKCLDADQIGMDVSRCTWHLLNGSQRSRRRQMRNKHKKKVSTLLKRKQRRLGNLINLVLLQSYGDTNNGADEVHEVVDAVLDEVLDEVHSDATRKNQKEIEEDKLRYYQGYHDICCIVQSALGGVTTKQSISSSTTTRTSTSTSTTTTTTIIKNKSRLPKLPPTKTTTTTGISNTTFNNTTNTPSMAAIKTARSLGMELPTQVLLQLSKSHLRDSMRSNFELLTKALRVTIMPLIAAFDTQVHDFLYKSEVEPFFAISWIITWFSHDVRDTALVKRLFDVFIVSHPTMPIYMSVAMVLHPMNRTEVLDTECDFAAVHNTLSHLPRNSCNVGWRFIGGPFDGEYVSGDEQEDVDTEVMSLDTGIISNDDMTSIHGDTGRGDPYEQDDNGSIAPSLASSSMWSSGDPSRVSFEELIELSLSFMQRIPPRQLTSLAKRYSFNKMKRETILEDISSISLLQKPPSWALQNSVPSDYILRKQQRKRQQQSQGKKPTQSDEIDIKTLQKKYNSKRVNKNDDAIFHAIVAAGIGPDGDGDIRRRKMLKKQMIRACLVVAVAVGYQFVSSSGGTITVPTTFIPAMTSQHVNRDLPSTSTVTMVTKQDDYDSKCDAIEIDNRDNHGDNQVHTTSASSGKNKNDADQVPSEPSSSSTHSSAEKNNKKAKVNSSKRHVDGKVNTKVNSKYREDKVNIKDNSVKDDSVPMKATNNKKMRPDVSKLSEVKQTKSTTTESVTIYTKPALQSMDAETKESMESADPKQSKEPSAIIEKQKKKKKFGFGWVEEMIESAKKNMAEHEFDDVIAL